MKKKLLIVLPIVLLLAGGGAYKTVLAPKKAEAKRKISGTLLPLDPEFVVNLAGGRYGKVSVALLVKKAPPAPQNGAAPELEQNAAVRSVITDELTGIEPITLLSPTQRHRLLNRVVKALHASTDEEITKVYFTDIAIQ
jgi:flagellar FliL protein